MVPPLLPGYRAGGAPGAPRLQAPPVGQTPSPMTPPVATGARAGKAKWLPGWEGASSPRDHRGHGAGGSDASQRVALSCGSHTLSASRTRQGRAVVVFGSSGGGGEKHIVSFAG